MKTVFSQYPGTVAGQLFADSSGPDGGCEVGVQVESYLGNTPAAEETPQGTQEEETAKEEAGAKTVVGSGDSANNSPGGAGVYGPEIGYKGLGIVAREVQLWNFGAGQLEADVEDQKKRWDNSPQDRELAVKIFIEEAEELMFAALENNKELILDGVADVLFTAIGIAAKAGLTDKVGIGFYEALASNMTKLIGVERDPNGKVRKGPFFKKPRFDLLVKDV